MSYILDALKKADEARHRTKGPALDRVRAAGDAPRRRWPWLVTGAVLIAVNGAVLFYVLWPGADVTPLTAGVTSTAQGGPGTDTRAGRPSGLTAVPPRPATTRSESAFALPASRAPSAPVARVEPGPAPATAAAGAPPAPVPSSAAATAGAPPVTAPRTLPDGAPRAVADPTADHQRSPVAPAAGATTPRPATGTTPASPSPVAPGAPVTAPPVPQTLPGGAPRADTGPAADPRRSLIAPSASDTTPAAPAPAPPGAGPTAPAARGILPGGATGAATEPAVRARRSRVPPSASIATPASPAPAPPLAPPVPQMAPGGAPAAAPGSDDVLSKLKLTVHVYAESPADRLVFIDGRKYVQGERIEGKALLEEITQDGAVVSFEGRRSLLRP